MRRRLVAATLVFYSTATSAQLPSGDVPIVRRRGADSAGLAAADGADPFKTWVGATVAYNFATSGQAADKLGVAARATLNSWRPKWNTGPWTFAVPIVGNVAKPSSGGDGAEELELKAQELLTSSEGIYVGVAPYFERPLNRAKTYALRLVGAALARTNAVKDRTADTTFYLTHSRFSVGALLAIGGFDVGTGVLSAEFSTLRVNPDKYELAFGERKRRLSSIELVLIVPIADNVGILGQAVLDQTGPRDNAWRLGVVLRPK
jgi:hypothetical protein